MTLADIAGVPVPPPGAPWREHWRGMPEYEQGAVRPYRSIDVHFRDAGDALAFASLLDSKGRWSMKCSRRVRPFLWGPAADAYARSNAVWVAPATGPVLPAYPIYIVSKGRADIQMTSRALADMGVPHYTIVEAAEVEAYAQMRIPGRTLLTLDPAFQEDYDAFDNDDPRPKGSGPARNFAWAHALRLGARYQWTMDDNIDGFWRLHRNRKVRVRTSGILRAMEAFVERYTNVLMAGPHYEMFITRRDPHPPYITNSRVYSCNLIRTDAPYRWAGRYNEDTYLSLRMLQDGYATVLFNAFLQNKKGTQQMKGGNTDILYADGTKRKSDMLADMIRSLGVFMQQGRSSNVRRWGRDHHYIDYSQFKQALVLGVDPATQIPDGVNPFGMELRAQPRESAVKMRPIRMRWHEIGTDYAPRVIRVHFTNAQEVDDFAAMTELAGVRDHDAVWYPAQNPKYGMAAEAPPPVVIPEGEEDDDDVDGDDNGL